MMIILSLIYYQYIEPGIQCKVYPSGSLEKS